ncbi:hypothetical protein ABBQ38_014760 [Trebouxia sp. C0009 RCD-2024]
MLAPGLLGEKDDFGQRYCGGAPEEVAPGVTQWLGSSNLDELNAVLTRHLMVRRLKKDVLKELPPKLHQQILVDVTAAHAAEIRRIFTALNKIRGDKNLADDRKRLAGVELQRLYVATGNAKISGAVEQVQATLDEGQKVIVFAHHLAMLDGLEQQLGPEHNAIRIDGSTSMDARKQLVDHFQQDPDVRLAILSITAAGTGITLTAAQCVVFAELSWNPGHLIQWEAWYRQRTGPTGWGRRALY